MSKGLTESQKEKQFNLIVAFKEKHKVSEASIAVILGVCSETVRSWRLGSTEMKEAFIDLLEKRDHQDHSALAVSGKGRPLTLTPSPS